MSSSKVWGLSNPAFSSVFPFFLVLASRPCTCCWVLSPFSKPLGCSLIAEMGSRKWWQTLPTPLWLSLGYQRYLSQYWTCLFSWLPREAKRVASFCFEFVYACNQTCSNMPWLELFSIVNSCLDDWQGEPPLRFTKTFRSGSFGIPAHVTSCFNKSLSGCCFSRALQSPSWMAYQDVARSGLNKSQLLTE